MDYNDLKNLNAQELAKKKTDIEFELMKARAQAARGTVAKNPHQIGGLRKALARIQMLLAVPAASQSTPAKASASTRKNRTTNGGKAKA